MVGIFSIIFPQIIVAVRIFYQVNNLVNVSHCNAIVTEFKTNRKLNITVG